MKTADQLLGLIGFDSVRTRRTYVAGEINLLKSIADLMCAALMREKTAQAMMVAEAELGVEKERFRIIATR